VDVSIFPTNNVPYRIKRSKEEEEMIPIRRVMKSPSVPLLLGVKNTKAPSFLMRLLK
jgi:hypothetical protein